MAEHNLNVTQSLGTQPSEPAKDRSLAEITEEIQSLRDGKTETIIVTDNQRQLILNASSMSERTKIAASDLLDFAQ